MTFTLYSDDLRNKWGFRDGDIFEDLCWEYEKKHGLERNRVDDHQVLRRVVETHLLPRLPGIEVDFIHSCHNPIRAKFDDEKGWPDFEDFEVEVTRDQIEALIPECLRSDEEMADWR